MLGEFRLLLSAAIVASATLSLPAQGAPTVQPFQGNPGGPRVAVIGDSITVLSQDDIHYFLDANYFVSVDGRSGFTIAEQFPVADVYAAQAPPPAIVVVNLGTNDMTRATPLWAAGFNMGTLTGKFGAARCIVLVDVNGNTLNTAWNQWAASFNANVVHLSAQLDPRYRVVRWHDFVKSYYAQHEPWGPLTTDLIHPTTVGQFILGSLIKDAVNTCPR